MQSTYHAANSLGPKKGAILLAQASDLNAGNPVYLATSIRGMDPRGHLRIRIPQRPQHRDHVRGIDLRDVDPADLRKYMPLKRR